MRRIQLGTIIALCLSLCLAAAPVAHAYDYSLSLKYMLNSTSQYITDLDAHAGQDIQIEVHLTNKGADAIDPIVLSLNCSWGGVPTAYSRNVTPGNTAMIAVVPLVTVPTPAPVGQVTITGTMDITENSTLTSNIPFSVTGKQPAPAPAPAQGGTPYAEEPAPRENQRANIASTSGTANVYAEPNERSQLLGTARAGESVELLQWDSTGTWCKIIYNGGNNAGWVAGVHLK